MNRFFYTIVALFIFFLCHFSPLQAQKKEKKTDIIDQFKTKAAISIPKGFYKMTNKEIALKDNSVVAPNKAYTSSDKRADIFIKETPCPFDEKDTDLMLKFYKSNLMSFFDKIEWIEEKTVKIKGNKFVRLVFISTSKPSKNNINHRRSINKYTIIHTKIVGDKKVNIVFTFPPQEKKKWLSIADKTMRSIRI